MVDLKHNTEKQALESIQNIEQYISSISISNFKSNIPRVNFRKIKLNKFQNLFAQFKLADLPTSYFSENIQQVDFPIRQKELVEMSEGSVVNPLRKKKDDDEKPPIFENENIPVDTVPPEQESINESPFSISNILEESEESIENTTLPQVPVLKPKNQSTSEDVTFNLEAQVLQEEQNVVLAPELPSTPEVKEDLISSSGKQNSFVWPPVSEKKTIKKGKTKKLNQPTKTKKKKKKSYFLSEQTSSTGEAESPENKLSASTFPWNLSKDGSPSVDENPYSGLESELLDIPEQVPVSQTVENEIPAKTDEQPLSKFNDVQKELEVKKLNEKVEAVPFTGPIVYKAVSPNIAFESLSENMINDVLKNTSWVSKMLDKFNKLEFGIVVTGKGEKKAEKMFDKNGFKLTPIRIIILGGALATLGYSAWNYLLPIINSNNTLQEDKKVVVKNLFKSKTLKKKDSVSDVESQDKLEMSGLVEGMSFSPITEEERFSLIQMARESLESRLDPFGQEEVLPREVVEQKKEELKETGPVEISINRKQVELVGVISANNKNLALVNVYNADYTITEDDDKATRDSKLKTALSMAVPNRLEVSLLDPVEDWYVKLIVKGKAKGDDPTIELVKEDKKFKLKVGQKLLLPEQKEPVKADAEDKKNSPKL